VAELKTPVVLTGVATGLGIEAELADCARDCDMAVEASGLLSEGAAVLSMAGPPLACELIEEGGGEVGVRG
jgi:hypothetical protein|tara:strand:+ start:7278 stop:7490 length:213 start_codon:yes stop_codon:yes gene_type:complete